MVKISITQEDIEKISISQEDIEKDVENLNLLENVFDKRVTEQDIEKEKQDIENQASSKNLIDKKDIEVKTELNDQEIICMSKLMLVASRHNAPLLKDFLHNMMTLKVSRHRRGRREFIDGLHAEERRDGMPKQSFLSRIFGGGGDS